MNALPRVLARWPYETRPSSFARETLGISSRIVEWLVSG
jgi:hypothetical protein